MSRAVLDLSKQAARDLEAQGVVENILGGMIGAVQRQLKAEAAGKKPKPPNAAGLAKIMLADLRARGYGIAPLK